MQHLVRGGTGLRYAGDAIPLLSLRFELGFHSAWLAEYHFTRYGLGSPSLVLATHIAACTSKIRLGTAVLVPTLHNPIQLAEDTTTLNSISRGRLDVGFVRDSDNYEYKSYNVAWEENQERFQEAIGVIQGLWTTSDYTHQGWLFSVNRANLVPPPLRKPHPPIYIAASRTRATLDYLVSTGHPLIIGVVLDTKDALELCHRFVTLSQETGHDVPMSRIPLHAEARFGTGRI